MTEGKKRERERIMMTKLNLTERWVATSRRNNRGTQKSD